MRFHLTVCAIAITGCSPDARIIGPDRTIPDQVPSVVSNPVQGVRYDLTGEPNGVWTALVPGADLSLQVEERDDGRWLDVDLVDGHSASASVPFASATVRHVRIMERMPSPVSCTGSGIGVDWLWVILPPSESAEPVAFIGGLGVRVWGRTDARPWRVAYQSGRPSAASDP